MPLYGPPSGSAPGEGGGTAEISEDEGNVLILGTDEGLFVPTPEPSVDDGDIAALFDDEDSATRLAAEDIWGSLGSGNPGDVGTATVSGPAGTLSGNSYTSVQWTINVTDGFLLNELRIPRTVAGTHTLTIDGNVIDTATGTGIVVFDTGGLNLGNGVHTFIVASTVANPLTYDSSGTVRSGAFYSFTEGDWSAFGALTARVTYVIASGPVTGPWEAGDKIWNESPGVSGPMGWVCVTGGTPGVWREFGVVTTDPVPEYHTDKTASFTTASLANLTSAQGVFNVAPGFSISKIQVNKGCRLRLYVSATKATADAGRAEGLAPSGWHGMILECFPDATGTFLLPGDVEGTAESASVVAYHITNKDTTGAITVTLTYRRNK